MINHELRLKLNALRYDLDQLNSHIKYYRRRVAILELKRQQIKDTMKMLKTSDYGSNYISTRKL